MTRGFPEFGCRIKTAKTKVNFKIAVPDSMLERGAQKRTLDEEGSTSTKRCYLPQLPNGSPWLRWCGLRINTRTLHVMADYSRFISDTSSSAGAGGDGAIEGGHEHRVAIIIIITVQVRVSQEELVVRATLHSESVWERCELAVQDTRWQCAIL